MGNFIGFFLDPCSRDPYIINTLCRVFDPENIERAPGNFAALMGVNIYFLPIILCWFPLVCVPFYEQYRRGLVYLALMVVAFGHRGLILLGQFEPDSLVHRAFIIMATYTACDTGLMGAYFDTPFIESVISFFLLGLCIMQYFFVLGYGAELWAYCLLPGFVTAFSLAQRLHVTNNTERLIERNDKGQVVHDRAQASQLGMLTILAMTGVAILMAALADHQDTDAFLAACFVLSGLVILGVLHVLRHPHYAVTFEYRSGGLFPPTSLKPQVTEAQYRAIMRKKAGLGTHTFLIDRPYS